jgi:hypothetical protein
MILRPLRQRARDHRTGDHCHEGVERKTYQIGYQSGGLFLFKPPPIITDGLRLLSLTAPRCEECTQQNCATVAE